MEIGSYYKTPPDMDDGFGYSLPRRDRGCTILGAIPGGTVIGPVGRFLTVQIVGPHGIEIEIPSPNRSYRTSWVMLCRGMSRENTHSKDRILQH